MQVNVIKPVEKTKKKLRVCAYARVSTEEDEQENSLENQKDYYEKLIRSNPSYEYVDVYYDFGISGYREMRPGFQKMLADARAGKIDLILTKSISRMSRNTVAMLKAVRELQSIGVGIFFELQNMNTLSGEGELMLSIYSAFAQAESDDCSKNAYMTYKRKFEAGIPAVRVHECYGYRLDSHGNLVLDEKEAYVVRKIFESALAGITPSEIARYLNGRGIKTAKGKEWICSSILRILRNEIYKGDVMMQKTYLDADRIRHRNRGERDRYYIADNHIPIVDSDDWNAVQEILDDRSIALKRGTKAKEVTGDSHNSYPLTGKLYCPKCGKMLHHHYGCGRKNVYWKCSTWLKKGRDKCRGISVPEEVAEQWTVLEETTVLETVDEFGRSHYSIIPKKEYEKRRDCPYKIQKRSGKYSHSTYPLSGRLYCSKCGSLMHHQGGWNGKEFWWCGKRVKQGADACEGVRVPAVVADTWEFEGCVYVTEGEDEDGKKCYGYQSKPKDDII